MPGKACLNEIQAMRNGLKNRDRWLEEQQEKIRELRQLIANQDAEIKELRERIVTASEAIDDVIRLLDDYRDVMLICMESMEKTRNKINAK